MKLIYVYSWGDEGCSGTSIIPFEYNSKEQFVFDILEAIKKIKWEYYGNKTSFNTQSIQLIFDLYLNKGQLENVEYDVYTLEQWFENNKEKVIL